jgi:hypothetical protein
MYFSEKDKLTEIDLTNVNNKGDGESAKCSFEEVQAIFEKYFGKPSKLSAIIYHFTKMNKDDVRHIWRFKNITIIHKLWDRFGLEENILIRYK